QRVLGVMANKPETAIRAAAVAKSIPVIRVRVADEIGDRRIEIAAVKNHEHVIDEVVYIEQIFVSWIWRAIRIEALHSEVVRVIGEAIGSRLPQPRPRIHVAVRSIDRIRAGLDLNYVV